MNENRELNAADPTSSGPDVGKFAAIVNAVFPAATIYAAGARFRVRNIDALGYPIPNILRGRTGTVISVDGPVALAGEISSRSADVKDIDIVGLADVANLMGVVLEMVHIVRYDDTPDTVDRLSHTFIESESAPAQPDESWLYEQLHR
ncbi:hypothetical protein BKG82_26965 [Mycobacteroides chelonae]|uniref:Uncharacterized protein n=1 Tax=Mycobacteroides chelonae TaxID=1774 RepID=A0A1S1LGL9_MYCCH|nr:hypothetical protein [Mycobacteroides chelonae]OHU47295.1 hypothetical protein BKG82_26965 [Mycobacteroides chelonae]